MIQGQVGRGEPMVKIFIVRKWVRVQSTEQVAYDLNLTKAHITKLCDMGKLIATKVNGRWWVHDQVYNRRRVRGLPR